MKNKAPEEGLPDFETMYKTLEPQVAEKDAKITELTNDLQRTRADFENFRRRTRQEKEELAAVVTQNLLKDL